MPDASPQAFPSCFHLPAHIAYCPKTAYLCILRAKCEGAWSPEGNHAHIKQTISELQEFNTVCALGFVHNAKASAHCHLKPMQVVTFFHSLSQHWFWLTAV